MRQERALLWTIALLALLPPAALAYLGSHSRLLSDDYCHIAWSARYGMLGALRHVRDTWNGTFTSYFLQFLFESRGELAPALFPPLIIAIWLIGLAWLALIALRTMRGARLHWPVALIVSGLLVAASINGFQSAQSYYWMAASVNYTLPVALLVVIIAIALQPVLRPDLPVRAALAFVALSCFVNAGFSAMYLVFQGAVLTALLPFSLLFAPKASRPRCLLLIVTGLLGTAAAALVMMTAPGFSGRLGSHVYAELNLGPPIRALPELLSRSLEILFEQVGHQPAFTSFALMLSLGLCLGLCLYRPQPAPGRHRAAALARRPLWTGLVVQALFLPVLWAHTSDAPHFMGRFSAAFLLVIGLNIGQLGAFALLLIFRRRADKLLRGNESNWRAYICAILLAASLLFAFDQARSIHYRAATYLFVSAFALLYILLRQLADRVADVDSRLWRQLPLIAAGAALFSYLLLIALSLFALGFLSERILTGAAFLHVASGLIWGLGIGTLLRCSGAFAPSDRASSGGIRIGAALLTLSLACGIVIGQAQRLPNLRAFAAEWDARHKEIVRQRDSGSDAIVVPELSYNLGDLVHGFHIFDDTHNYCAKLYYGVASITRSTGGE